MSRFRPSLLALFLVAALLAGCGSSGVASEEVPGDPPVLTIPREKGADDPLADTGNASDQTANGDATPTPTATPATGTGTGTGTGTTTDGGTQAPATAPSTDGPNNDQAPAAGTAPDKFEEFCQQNEGAC